jgi:hypothetical protein
MYPIFKDILQHVMKIVPEKTPFDFFCGEIKKINPIQI